MTKDPFTPPPTYSPLSGIERILKKWSQERELDKEDIAFLVGHVEATERRAFARMQFPDE